MNSRRHSLTQAYPTQDPMDPRVGELVFLMSPSEINNLCETVVGPQVVVAGYPDDEGIKINGGRPGADQAPAMIRQFLNKMTLPLGDQNSKALKIFDLGDFPTHIPLEERHQQVQATAYKFLSAGHRWLGLGGGHDYGYPDSSAFVRYCQSQNVKPLIINFDAHLDVRPLDKGLSSGTPFYRLLSNYSPKNGETQLDFLEIGIQNQCNSQKHLTWALERGAKVLTYDEILFSGLSQHLVVLRFLEPYLVKKRMVFISIDIDGFSANWAKGCSQSWPSGLNVESFLLVFNTCLTRLDARMVGIYEVSPPLDFDNQTSKLAALLAHRYIFT